MPFLKTLIVNRKLLIGKKNPDERKTMNNKQSFSTNKPGLTLIELMIVIALIGILSSIGMYGFQSSQKKARDGQRKNDLQQVKKSLEAARNDCIGGSSYPDVGGANETAAFTALSTHLANTSLNYLSQAVKDPNNSGNYIYKYDRSSLITASACPNTDGVLGVNGTKYYILRAQLEITNDTETNSSRTKCQSTITAMTPWDANNGNAPAANDGYYYVCPD